MKHFVLIWAILLFMLVGCNTVNTLDNTKDIPEGDPGLLPDTGPTIQAGPDYAIFINPQSVTVGQGSSVGLSLKIESRSGFAGNLALSLQYPLTGMSLSPTSTTLAAGEVKTIPLTLSTTSATPLQTKWVNLIARSGSYQKSVALSVKVISGPTPPPPPNTNPDYFIQLTPNQLTVEQGKTITTNLLVESRNNLGGTANLSLSNALPGITLTPTSVAVVQGQKVNYTLTLSAVPNAITHGPRYINLLANVNGLVKSVYIVLTVKASTTPPPGSPDTGFGGEGVVVTQLGGTSQDRGQAVAIQSDGKIVVAGVVVYNSGGPSDIGLVRYNPNGSLDTSFGTGGKVITGFLSNSVSAADVAIIQSNGKIVVAGSVFNSSNSDFALARYNPDGSLDTSFDGDGRVITDFGIGNDSATSLVIQSDGKIVAAGQVNSFFGDADFGLARYNSDGSLDISFDSDGKVNTNVSGPLDIITALALQSDGKIVATGTNAGSSANSTPSDFVVVRYNSNGSLDTGFGTNGIGRTDLGAFHDDSCCVTIQSDGKIVVGGNSSGVGPVLVRYGSNGSLETSFGTSGKVISSIGSAVAIAIQSDGKIILAGRGVGGGFGLARHNPNGSLDITFGGGGSDPTSAVGAIISDIAIQADGKIVAAGSAAGFAVARYNP